MKNSRTVFNFVQNTLIFVLVASLLTLCGVYVYTENTGVSANLPSFPESHMHLISKDAQWNMKSGNSAFISPSFTALTVGGELYGGYSDRKNANAVWTEFERALALLSESEVKKEEFPDKDSTFEYVDTLFSAERKLYCEFSSPLPLSAIAVFFENTYNDNIIYKESFFAKYMIMICGSLDEAWLAILNESGDVITVKPRTALKFNTALTDSKTPPEGFEKAEFVFSDEARKEGFVGYIPVFSSVKELLSVEKKGFSEVFDVRTDSEDVSTIVRAFGMNPNNTNRYSTPFGVGFVESSGELSISAGGLISFSSDENGGVSLTKLLGYIPSDVGRGSYSFIDTVGAVCAVLDSFGTGILGGDAGLVLERSVYDSENDKIRFEFAYYIGGVRIETNRDADAVITFTDNALSEARIYAEVYSAMSDGFGDYQQKAALFAAKRQDRVITDFYASYISQDGILYNPRWTAEYSGKD